MSALILSLAGLAGQIIADQLRNKGKTGAAVIVTQSEAAARAIIETLAAHASTATNGELTAADVHTAYLAAIAEIDALIAEAEASLLSRQGGG